MMVHDTKKNRIVQVMFSLFHPLCRHQVIFSRRYRRKKQDQPYLLCCGGSHPAQIYHVIDCEVELYTTLYLHFVLDFNVQYITGCSTLFSFLESLLKLQSKQTRQPSVALFTASLT